MTVLENRKRFRGFSLIEMMLAMVLGMLVTGTVLQLMISNSQSAGANEFIAQAQANGRHTLYLLSREVRKAGYRSDLSAAPALPFYLGACEGRSTCTADGGGNRSDRVAIQYEPQNGVDCTGRAVAAGALTADVYFVAPDNANNGISTLFCRGYDPASARPRGSAMALIEGVERLQAVYGLVSGSAADINQYLTAAAVKDWKQVRGVRISVLVTSGQSARVFEQRSRTYNLLNSGNLSFNDQTPRYVYSTVIRLNNAGI